MSYTLIIEAPKYNGTYKDDEKHFSEANAEFVTTIKKVKDFVTGNWVSASSSLGTDVTTTMTNNQFTYTDNGDELTFIRQ